MRIHDPHCAHSMREVRRPLAVSIAFAGGRAQDFDHEQRCRQRAPGRVRVLRRRVDGDVWLEPCGLANVHAARCAPGPAGVRAAPGVQVRRQSYRDALVVVRRHRRHQQLAVQDLVAIAVVGQPLQIGDSPHGPLGQRRRRRRSNRHGHTVRSARARASAQGANICRG